MSKTKIELEDDYESPLSEMILDYYKKIYILLCLKKAAEKWGVGLINEEDG